MAFDVAQPMLEDGNGPQVVAVVLLPGDVGVEQGANAGRIEQGRTTGVLGEYEVSEMVAEFFAEPAVDGDGEASYRYYPTSHLDGTYTLWTLGVTVNRVELRVLTALKPYTMTSRSSSGNG